MEITLFCQLLKSVYIILVPMHKNNAIHPPYSITDGSCPKIYICSDAKPLTRVFFLDKTCIAVNNVLSLDVLCSKHQVCIQTMAHLVSSLTDDCFESSMHFSHLSKYLADNSIKSHNDWPCQISQKTKRKKKKKRRKRNSASHE